MTQELIKFNEMFPNSKYREVHAQYVGPIETDEQKSAYQASKAPINATILSFDQIKNTKNRIGWIVPKDYIVIDIDNRANARIVFDMLQKLNIKFSFMTGKKGGHFIFRNIRGIKSISAGKYCSLGFEIDVRCNEKGYIVLPENDTDRTWGKITNDIDDVPYFLTPLKDFRSQSDFNGMDNGDGRNDALHKHITGMIDYAGELTLDEKVNSIKLINNYLFKNPLTEDELNKTVLRADILKKQEQTQEEKGCYEERLATKIVKDKNIITCNDICYMYNGKYYKRVYDIAEIERIIHLEYNHNLKDAQRKEIIKFMKLKSFVRSDMLDSDWNKIVFKNGILDLATLRLLPHTPTMYNTVYIDKNYYNTAPYSQLIDDFLNEVSGSNIDVKTLLYEIIGQTMVRKNIFSKFYVIFGQGSTGKSTYLNLIKNLIGETNASFLSINDLEERFMPVNLFGKLVNLGDDIPYYIKETANLKKLVTGEMIEAQRKFQDSIHFSNFAKLIFTTNRLPEINDRTSGFYRRFMIIELNNKVENPDPFFFDRLTDEDYEYLLSKSIVALVNAIRVGHLTELPAMVKRLEEFKTEQSSVLTFMKEYDYTKERIDHRPCMELYNEYIAFCKETGFKALKKVNFDKEICEEYKMTKRNTTWKKETEINQCWRYV